MIHCDIVEANPEQSLGKYEWITVLAWKGENVNRDEYNAEISRKAENLRGRILRNVVFITKILSGHNFSNLDIVESISEFLNSYLLSTQILRSYT